MSQNAFKTWLMAIRPKTLPASIAPVLMGTAMAFGDGIQHFPTAFVCLIGAVLIQIGTNLANDYFDYKKGSDTSERLGPVRVTQAGLVKPHMVLSAALLVFLLAGLASIWLVLRGGWPLAIIALFSILSGLLYTSGPFPLGYLGFGELFVLVFFGPVAVGGTYYVQSFELNTAVLLAGISCGLFSTAILAVNNLRDIDTDRKSGKLTLAVRFGQPFAQIEYFILTITAFLMPVLIFILTRDHLPTLWSVSLIFLLIPMMPVIFKSPTGKILNKGLAYTGVILLLFSIVFSIGWIL